MTKQAGSKTEDHNLSSSKIEVMLKVMKAILSALLLFGSLAAAPTESLAIQEMRLALEQAGRQMHSHNVELNLFHERMLGVERSMDSLKQQLKGAASDKSLEKRLANVERTQEALLSDLKTLKTHTNENQLLLSQCQTQLTKLEEQIGNDIRNLKLSLHSMVALLQGTSAEEARTHIVKSGDSLSQIAQLYKTDIKTLKKINNLQNDTIYSGQKLLLP